ncbi:hypothetical protein BLNAU_24765 [Blattamonas nauphoetae]|uniref:Protein kinase domain-containing protein n=1 Tax=Blattamonas nauphoetae TaxID=2049346 RepID=A0ABQ9WLH5_9EUKA|nr:hypothetical protein BLNAU_24765 [Blattamonas nauphoetae]
MSSKSTFSLVYTEMDDMDIDQEDEGMIDPNSFICSEENRIGKGGSAPVYHVHSNKTKKDYALKLIEIPDDEMRRQMAEDEIRILLKLRGRPGIIQLYNDPRPIVSSSSVRLVMELGQQDLSKEMIAWKYKALDKMGKERNEANYRQVLVL